MAKEIKNYHYNNTTIKHETPTEIIIKLDEMRNKLIENWILQTAPENYVSEVAIYDNPQTLSVTLVFNLNSKIFRHEFRRDDFLALDEQEGRRIMCDMIANAISNWIFNNYA